MVSQENEVPPLPPWHEACGGTSVCVCVCVFFSCIGERVKKCSNVFGDISLGVREELVLFSGLIAKGLRLDAACIYRC